MAESREYNPTTAETLVVEWLERSIDTPDVQVIIANQGFGRPQKPFVMVEILSDIELEPARQCTGAMDSPGFYEVITIERRMATVQVRAFGRLAYEIMREIDRSRHREDIIQANGDAGIEVQEAITSIQILAGPMGTTTEQSRTQDYRVSYVEETTEEQSQRVVERVIGTGEIDPDPLPVTVDVTAP